MMKGPIDDVVVGRIDDRNCCCRDEEEWLDVQHDLNPSSTVRTASVEESSFELIDPDKSSNVNELLATGEGLLLNSHDDDGGGEEEGYLKEQYWTSLGYKVVDTIHTSCLHMPVGSERWKSITILVLMSILFCQNINHHNHHHHHQPSTRGHVPLSELDDNMNVSFLNDSNNAFYVLSLIDQIKALEYTNDQYGRQLSQLVKECTKWRDIANACNVDLNHQTPLLYSYFEQDDVVMPKTRRKSRTATAAVAVAMVGSYCDTVVFQKETNE
jgi:hypothetical protein